MTPRLCPLCGKAIPPELRRGRPRRYCSTEHADAAANRRRPRVPALDLEEEVRKAELADQEAWAAAEAAAESATAASQEAAAAVQRAQSRWKGQETVDSALGLVEGLKATREQIIAAEPAGARTAESESLRDDYREQYGRVKASALALLVYQEWITGRFLVEVQAAAQAKTADAERVREILNTDVRRRARRAAAARRRRAEGPKPLPQNAAGRVVYPAWHARAGQEIREG